MAGRAMLVLVMQVSDEVRLDLSGIARPARVTGLVERA